jgi:hypothetical protein
MSDRDLVGDYADSAFLRLTAGGAEGTAELARSGLAFGVLSDHDGRPLQLLTPDGRAPVVAISANETMRRVMAGDIVGLLNSGVPALVVVRDSRVAGILSAETVSDYLVEHASVRSGVLGDEQLHGDAPITPLTLICTTCGTANIVPYFVAGETRCRQDHLLTVTWD